MLNQFSNLSCYEEFEIQCALTGISKVDVVKIIGHQINDYYFLVSEDGIFTWFDLEGNHVEDPYVLKTIKEKYIPKTITKCIIPNCVISIGSGAFWGCDSLKEINIPNSVIDIGESTFYHCTTLKEITIPNSVTRISHKAFVCCESLTSITISDSVTNIGRWAFSHCDSLKEIVFKGKTLKRVKQMMNYPFGIEDESTIKCEM